MKLGQHIVDGIFVERPNRYLARVKVDGQEVQAHVPDPGRLPGLMIPKMKVRLIHNPGPKRKTDYTLALVRHGSIWVSVYPVFANKLVGEALSENKLSFLSGYQSFSAEVKVGSSRIDFKLDFPEQSLFIEVKSVSHVESSVGKFPDAPTERGRKHLRELIELKNKGVRAGVLFVSQRNDTKSVTSNDLIDPAFGQMLREAHQAGVELYACNCKVTASSITINRQIDVVLPTE
ncbi:MAG: DNA/RNA nuclease SfsA [Nitrospinales bacterium]